MNWTKAIMDMDFSKKYPTFTLNIHQHKILIIQDTNGNYPTIYMDVEYRNTTRPYILVKYPHISGNVDSHILQKVWETFFTCTNSFFYGVGFKFSVKNDTNEELEVVMDTITHLLATY